MLGKIFKHEFKAIGKVMWLLYAISGGLTLLSGFIWPHVDYYNPYLSALSGSLIGISVLAMIAVVLGTVIMLCARFGATMAGKEAYFTFTLPVKNSTHMLARFLVSLLYTFIACFILAVEIIFICGFGNVAMLFRIMDPGTVISVFFFIFLLMFVVLFAAQMQIYAAIAVGTYLTKNRLLGTIAALFIFSAALNIIMSFVMIPFTYLINDLISFLLGNIFEVNALIWVIFAIVAGVEAVFCAVYYLLSWLIFCRKLKGTS